MRGGDARDTALLFKTSLDVWLLCGSGGDHAPMVPLLHFRSLINGSHTQQRTAAGSAPPGYRLVEPNAKAKYEGDTLGFTDVDNAERLIRRHGSKLRYCPQWKCWLLWDGQRWKRDESGEITELAKDTASRLVSGLVISATLIRQRSGFASLSNRSLESGLTR